MVILRPGDVAACTGTSIYIIRELSRYGLLGPEIRSDSGNRQYDPRVIPVVHLWRTLQRQGLGTKELRMLGQNRTPEKSKALFLQYRDKLSAEIAQLHEDIDALRAREDMLDGFISMIEEGQTAEPDGIFTKALPEQPIRVSPLVLPGEKAGAKPISIERQRRAFERLKQNKNTCCPIGFAYQDFSTLLKQQDRPSQFVAYDPQGPEVRPAGEYLIGTEHCCYEQVSALPERMAAYASEHSLEFIGPAYTTSLLDAASVTTREQFVFQVAVRIR